MPIHVPKVIHATTFFFNSLSIGAFERTTVNESFRVHLFPQFTTGTEQALLQNVFLFFVKFAKLTSVMMCDYSLGSISLFTHTYLVC
jgi:hypothetical protein